MKLKNNVPIQNEANEKRASYKIRMHRADGARAVPGTKIAVGTVEVMKQIIGCDLFA